MQTCEVCKAKVDELRRGRCWGCYARWVERRPVGLGASCVICDEKRRDCLRSVELLGNWRPACHNCAGRLAKLRPMPQTIAGIQAALRRERRVDDDRRVGEPDERDFQWDRRFGDRRKGGSSDDELFVDDDMVIDVQEAAELSSDEVTTIR